MYCLIDKGIQSLGVLHVSKKNTFYGKWACNTLVII